MNALTDTFRTAAEVARRELSASFRSPVALVFLGVFLVAVNLDLFTLSGFFARGLADLKPLFASLPLLLLLLVSALTMRQWAEERKLGTLEVLLTLPVRPWGLVIGKWLAGVGLVALALALTWPLPVLVGLLGPLDLGPVVGGYLGALLVGATWVAVGLCVSSRTDNQVVALIVTLGVGGVLLLLGDDAFTSLFGRETADILRGLGAGSRFDSIERGVVDLRDLAYYGGITATALTLNVAFLELPRIDGGSHPQRQGARWLHVSLVASNALLLSLWLSPLTTLRVDLTADGAYSLSPVTRDTLASLDEPLYIEAYLSDRTHPLIAPLLPRIRDTLREVDAIGGDRVRLTLADPATDDELAAEIGETYGIESVPFGVADRSSQSVVNAWFHVLVRYGDQHEVLGLEDLVEFDADVASTEVDVRLGDLEYVLARTIRKVSRSFQSVDAQLARLPEGSTLTLYATPETAPREFQGTLSLMREKAAELAERSGGRLAFEEVAPTPDQAQAIYEETGVRPLAADLFGQELFWAHLVLTSGDKVQRLLPGADATAGDVSRSLEAAVRRASPGQLVQVGLYTATPEAPPPNPNLPPQMQPPPPRPDYQALRQILLEGYDVTQVDLSEGDVPDHLDVLLLAKAGPLTDEARWAIDQYLMRGGAVIALAGAFEADFGPQGGLSLEEAPGDLRELLAHYGVDVEEALVLDPRNAPFPLPVQEQRGAYVLERIELLPYPFFPDVRGGSLDGSHPATSGLTNVTMPWSSPVRAAEELPEGVTARTFLESSDRAWTQTGTDIQPDFTTWPDAGFGPPADAERGARPLALTLTGPMRSWFADKPSPVWDAEAESDGEGDVDPTGRTLTEAAPEARLAVVGSAEGTSDLLVRLAESISGERHRGNLQLVQNLIDWSTEDTDLLAIRSAGAFARTLDPMEPDDHRIWEIAAYTGALIPLVLLGALPLVLRRRLPPELARLDRAPDLPAPEASPAKEAP